MGATIICLKSTPVSKFLHVDAFKKKLSSTFCGRRTVHRIKQGWEAFKKEKKVNFEETFGKYVRNLGRFWKNFQKKWGEKLFWHTIQIQSCKVIPSIKDKNIFFFFHDYFSFVSLASKKLFSFFIKFIVIFSNRESYKIQKEKLFTLFNNSKMNFCWNIIIIFLMIGFKMILVLSTQLTGLAKICDQFFKICSIFPAIGMQK